LNQPDRLLSMIIDGADQTKYQVPHFRYKTKASEQVPHLQVIDVTVHGVGHWVHSFQEHRS
jgi:hypothetical protein